MKINFCYLLDSFLCWLYAGTLFSLLSGAHLHALSSEVSGVIPAAGLGILAASLSDSGTWAGDSLMVFRIFLSGCCCSGGNVSLLWVYSVDSVKFKLWWPTSRFLSPDGPCDPDASPLTATPASSPAAAVSFPSVDGTLLSAPSDRMPLDNGLKISSPS